MSENPWYRAKDEAQLMTPGLLVYPDRIKHNIESMIRIAGDVNRLIPHVKTYKMQAIVKCKCAMGFKNLNVLRWGNYKC